MKVNGTWNKDLCFGYALGTILLSEDLLELFHELLNKRLPGIKFTKTFYRIALNFLIALLTVFKIISSNYQSKP